MRFSPLNSLPRSGRATIAGDVSGIFGGETAGGVQYDRRMDPVWRDAIVGGDVAAVQTLLSHGADVDARDRYGQTALMLAALHGHDAIVAMLLAAGAALNVAAKYGLSALMLAVVGGHAESARRIARAGADRTLRGTGAPGFAGKTAYDLAIAAAMHDLAVEIAP